MTSISQERSRLANVGMVMRRRNQWGAVHNYNVARTVDDPANRVFVHITVTDPNNLASNDAHARLVEAIGRQRFGTSSSNTGISYNRLIMRNGAIYEAQPHGRRGAHTVNDYRRSSCTTSGCPSRGQTMTAPGRSWNLNFNARAYAFCGIESTPVSNAVVDSIARAIAADMLAGLVTRNAPIHGHRCCSAKACPGNLIWQKMGAIRSRVNYYLSRGHVGDGAPPKEDDDMTPEQARQLEQLHAVLINGNGAMIPHPNPANDNQVSVREGVRQGWARSRQADLQTRNIASDVHNRENPTLGIVYGTMDRYMFNAIRPDRSQTPGARVGFLRDLDRIEEKVDAALAAQLSSGDLEQVKSTIDAHHAELKALAEQADDRVDEIVEQNDNLAAKLREVLDGQDDMREHIEAALAGELDAMDALRALHGIIGDAVLDDDEPSGGGS